MDNSTKRKDFKDSNSSPEEKAEEDLYGDLSGTKAAAANAKDESRTKSKLTARNEVHPGCLSTQVEKLQHQVESLQTENDTLRRNIGTLYRTAKSEIQRKDTEIESLMKQLEQRK